MKITTNTSFDKEKIKSMVLLILKENDREMRMIEIAAQMIMVFGDKLSDQEKKDIMETLNNCFPCEQKLQYYKCKECNKESSDGTLFLEDDGIWWYSCYESTHLTDTDQLLPF